MEKMNTSQGMLEKGQINAGMRVVRKGDIYVESRFHLGT